MGSLAVISPISHSEYSKAAMKILAPVLCSVLVGLLVPVKGFCQTPRDSKPLIAIFIVDGLRPDSINTLDTPTIARLRKEGVEYLNSHSIFPTVTRVNATALATGTYPVLNGIVGNSMFVSGVNQRTAFDTGDYKQLLKLEQVSGRIATVETLGEILQRNRRNLVTVSSGSTGNGFLLNPTAAHGNGIAIHGLFDPGKTAAYPKQISDAVIQRFGSPPSERDEIGLMNWTDNVLREYVLQDLLPDVVIDWEGPLDSAQHANGVGSPQAKEALHQIDQSISRTISKIEALGLLSRTDIIIGSDHGFAHNTDAVNLLDKLVTAGLKKAANSTDIILASQGQSILLYLMPEEREKLGKLVGFLQQQPSVDLIFTRNGKDGLGSVPGTFSLDLISASHPSRAADVVVSMAWTSKPNPYGVRGTQTINSNMTGRLPGVASGHGGLNPWVIHNTFLAWGADFKKQTRIDVPVSLADVTPTVLTLLGIDVDESNAGRGRILREVMKGAAAATTKKRILKTSAGSYEASLQISTAAGHDYIDTGSRQRAK